MLAALILGAPGASAQTDTPEPMVAGWTRSTLFFPVDEDDRVTGFSASLARALTRRTGIPIEFREYPTARALVEDLFAGELTIFPGLAALPRFAAGTEFSDPVAVASAHFIVLTGNDVGLNIDEVSGFRIGVLPPTLGSDAAGYSERNTIVEWNNSDSMLLGLISGDLDAVIVSKEIVSSFGPESGLDGRFVAVGRPLVEVERVVAVHPSRTADLPAINAAIADMVADGELARLNETWLAPPPEPTPERLTVGVPDSPPYAWIDEDGTATGFSVEVLRDIAALANLRLNFVPLSPEEAAAGPRRDTYDLLVQLLWNVDGTAGNNGTLPIEVDDLRIFVRRGDAQTLGDGLAGLSGRRVGVLRGSHGEGVASAQADLDPVVFEERAALAAALAAGEVDAVLTMADAFRRFVAYEGVSDGIDQVNPAIQSLVRVIGVRPGIPAVRDQLNRFIPGYLASARYASLRGRYFGVPLFWTTTRVYWAIGLGTALLSVTFLGLLFMRREARLRARNLAATTSANERLNGILATVNSGIFGLDRAGNVLIQNAVAREMLGGSPAEPPFPWPESVQFSEPQSVSRVSAGNPIARATAGEKIRSETHVMTRDGKADTARFVSMSSDTVSDTTTGLAAVVVLEDVTERERSRQQIERSSRLDALGQLTSGIAHDFNNLLATILYAVQLASDDATSDRSKRILGTALRSVDRGRDLTNRLLAFARRQPGDGVSRPLSEVFDEVERLLRPTIEAQIGLEFEIEDPALHVFCDQAQLENALVNLIINSRDAILQSGTGSRITVNARGLDGLDIGSHHILGRTEPGKAPAARRDRYVDISVHDDGPGMSPHVQEHALDPFFTTKDSESAAGLGLSMVYGFTQNSGGDLVLYSEPGNGTTMRMLLPLGSNDVPDQETTPRQPIRRGKGQTVLVVEDEPGLMAVLCEVLEGIGYRPISAISAPMALVKVEEGAEFDVLLTDILMPGRTGFELASDIRKLRPDVPVIYISGHAAFQNRVKATVPGPVLQKPCPPDKLAAALEKALSEPVAT